MLSFRSQARTGCCLRKPSKQAGSDKPFTIISVPRGTSPTGIGPCLHDLRWIWGDPTVQADPRRSRSRAPPTANTRRPGGQTPTRCRHGSSAAIVEEAPGQGAGGGGIGEVGVLGEGAVGRVRGG